MSSKKKRNKNRDTAQKLKQRVKDHTPCSRCGELGAHFVHTGLSLESIMGGDTDNGFWICPNLYGPNGRRIDTSDAPNFMKIFL